MKDTLETRKGNNMFETMPVIREAQRLEKVYNAVMDSMKGKGEMTRKQIVEAIGKQATQRILDSLVRARYIKREVRTEEEVEKKHTYRIAPGSARIHEDGSISALTYCWECPVLVREGKVEQKREFLNYGTYLTGLIKFRVNRAYYTWVG